MNKDPFRMQLSRDLFHHKYAHQGAGTWSEMAHVMVDRVCASQPKDIRDAIEEAIRNMKFIPGGRYLYYASRDRKFFNNCLLLRAEEDTRKDWADLSWKAESSLMTGAGIGVDYSVYRASGSLLKGTGGEASGPIPKMQMINEIGRHVMQGGSRRSAIYASLNWKHDDVHEFLHAKDWQNMPVAGTQGASIADLKAADFNYKAPLDMTNISVNYDTEWHQMYKSTGDPGTVFLNNVKQALRTGEPGFSFNMYGKDNETLRNACTEVTSEDDSDICNLGSLNLARIESLEEMSTITGLATIFLLCGTLVAEVPYEKVDKIRSKNRRLGLGLMGVHEWLLKRGYKYEINNELKQWLDVYRRMSIANARYHADKLSISIPVALRAIAPTGTIGNLASTTTGIEPIYAVAYKRRYLKGAKDWHYQYVLDETAAHLIRELGVKPEEVETAADLATDYERRIKFQADVQDYVDMAISSTINLPAWGTPDNNESMVSSFAKTLAEYSHRLRGFTCYPDGSRGGQPLVAVPYEEAKDFVGTEFVETPDICEITGKGGVCGV